VWPNRVSRSVIATTSWAIGRRAALYSSSGLRDSYGVPIGNYYFAVASVRDRIAAAPDVDWKPDTWMAWMTHALGSVMASLAAANILTVGRFINVTCDHGGPINKTTVY
jgi:hypothetical protein